MESKKKNKKASEQKNENASPVCYANSSELREEFLEPIPKKSAPRPDKPKSEGKS